MNPPWDRRDTTAALSIAALAFAPRLVLALLSPVVGGDSAAFLLGAKEIATGDWATSLRNGIHPGYPLAILLAGGGETGARLVSVLFSSLAAIPFYALARDMAGRRVATVSALFFACLPYLVIEHADVMTEGLFHCLFVATMLFGWLGATRASARWFAAAAVVGALAYYTRPEGVYTVGALLGLASMALVAARLRREPVPWRTLALAIAAVALFVALILPLLHWYGGKITHRGSVETALQTFSGTAEQTDWAGAFRNHVYQLGRCLMWFVGGFVLLGLALLRGRIRPLGAIYLGCLSIGYSAAPVMASAHGYPLSHRYVLVSALFLLAFAGIGCVALADLAARRFGGRPARIGAAIALGAIMVGLVARAVHPREDRETTVKDAALWLRERGGDRAVVYSNTNKASCYLSRRVRMLCDHPRFELQEGEFLFVNEDRLRADSPGALESFESRYRRVTRFAEKERDTVSIFAR